MLSSNFGLAVLCSLVSLSSITTAGVTKRHGYHLVEEYKPHNFFDKFRFFQYPDPTNGFVQYIDRKEANETGLIRVHRNHTHPVYSYAYVGVDHTNTYSLASLGRKSVRLQSRKSYTRGLFILNLEHMPHGCGTWPAWWTYGPEWPSHGEIDIIEGVNKNRYNLMSLHTDKGCTIAGAKQKGILITNNCDSTQENVGCGVLRNKSSSYGEGFNRNNGGVYAMEWTASHIKIWQWHHREVPKSITEGKPDPSKFGLPLANLAGSCNINQHFRDHTIVFDMTFCGDFAGYQYRQSDCPLSNLGHLGCNEYVARNPDAFKRAHWKIRSMHVYQEHGSDTGHFHEPKYSSVPPLASTATKSMSLLPPPQGHSTTTTTFSRRTSTKKHHSTTTKKSFLPTSIRTSFKPSKKHTTTSRKTTSHTHTSKFTTTTTPTTSARKSSKKATTTTITSTSFSLPTTIPLTQTRRS